MTYLPSIRAELSQSGHSAGIHRTPCEGARRGFGGGWGCAERCTDERSGETRADSRRALPRRYLSLRQRHRGCPARTALQRRLTARPPHAGPRGPSCHPRSPAAAAAGRLALRGGPPWEPPGADSPGDRGNLRLLLRIPRAAGSPVPRGSGGAGTARGGRTPHAWRGGGPARSPRASPGRSLRRLASRLAEICHLLSPHRKLAG